MSVLVVDGKIQKIAQAGKLHQGPDIRTIVGKGGYLLPGLMDMHVHINEKSELGLYVAHGVTTVRNMRGGPTHLQWREQIAQGKMVGPTIYTASPIIDGGDQWSWLTKRVNTPAEGKGAVDRYVEQGYDFIKVYSYLNQKTYQAIISQAKVHKIPVVGHPPYDVPLKQVLQSGQQTFEHAEEVVQGELNFDLNEKKVRALAQSFRDSGIVFVPTLIVFHKIVQMSQQGEKLLEDESVAWIHPLLIRFATNKIDSMVSLTPEQKRYLERQEQFQQMIVKIFHDHGVKIALGTDAGVRLTIPGASVYEELELYVKAGLSPLEALKTSTVHAAKALGIQNEVGTIAEGKEADLLLVHDNPLENLQTLKNPLAVMVKGNWYAPKDLKALKEKGTQHVDYLEAARILFDQFLAL